MSEERNHIHIIGIGGIGMSAIAKVLLEMGHSISGSDSKESDITKRLVEMGAQVYIGHARNNLNHPQAVVVSSAIPDLNPEIQKAQEENIPIFHRAEMLAKIMEGKRSIAVAGAHGKTTTTSMISLMLEKNNYDPTVLIGGELNDIGGNAKLGSGEFLVAEADESDGSFLKLPPEIVVVTNIDADHLDYYKDINQIVEAFEAFINKIPSNGFAVLCQDNAYLRDIARRTEKRVITYGFSSDADYTVCDLQQNGMKSAFTVMYRGEELGKMRLHVPGKHNVVNSLAAVAVGREIGLSLSEIAEALSTFSGARRRFQTKGEVNGIWVVDDYAHHPAEIKATLEAAAQVGAKRVIVAFQPHRYTRTKALYKEFGKAFDRADEVIVNEIYSAGEPPIDGVSAALIVQEIEANIGKKVKYFKEKEEIIDYLADIAKPGDLVMTMGAGNIWIVGEQLVNKLKQR